MGANRLRESRGVGNGNSRSESNTEGTEDREDGRVIDRY